MPRPNPNKIVEIWDVSMTGTQWTVKDMRDLNRFAQEGYKLEDISKYLRRTISSVAGRLSANGYSVRKEGITRKFFLVPQEEEDKRSSAPVEIVVDPNQELFVWFMKHAWEEGFTIIIQELGASFQKPK